MKFVVQGLECRMTGSCCHGFVGYTFRSVAFTWGVTVAASLGHWCITARTQCNFSPAVQWVKSMALAMRPFWGGAVCHREILCAAGNAGHLLSPLQATGSRAEASACFS